MTQATDGDEAASRAEVLVDDVEPDSLADPGALSDAEDISLAIQKV